MTVKTEVVENAVTQASNGLNKEAPPKANGLGAPQQESSSGCSGETSSTQKTEPVAEPQPKVRICLVSLFSVCIFGVFDYTGMFASYVLLLV